MTPAWLRAVDVIAFHDRLLDAYGGLRGIRDVGLLQSALARPLNAFAYGERDIFKLAASYGAGIVRNHPFADGNKRTAIVSTLVFLEDHGHLLSADQTDVVDTVQALASGSLSEADFANWLRSKCGPGAAG